MVLSTSIREQWPSEHTASCYSAQMNKWQACTFFQPEQTEEGLWMEEKAWACKRKILKDDESALFSRLSAGRKTWGMFYSPAIFIRASSKTVPFPVSLTTVAEGISFTPDTSNSTPEEEARTGTAAPPAKATAETLPFTA